MGIGWQILWTACGVATLTAALLAGRRGWARYLGRAAVGLLFLVGGALLHVLNLVSGVDYADFADPAHFSWVTRAWRAVVAPDQVFFIGLLVVFEATVGALVLSGGSRTRLGYAGVIAFYLVLWPFGWFETVWCALMLVPMLLLWRAERYAPAGTGRPAARERPRVGVGR